jgi:hypothetical protein
MKKFQFLVYTACRSGCMPLPERPASLSPCGDAHLATDSGKLA